MLILFSLLFQPSWGPVASIFNSPKVKIIRKIWDRLLWLGANRPRRSCDPYKDTLDFPYWMVDIARGGLKFDEFFGNLAN